MGLGLGERESVGVGDIGGKGGGGDLKAKGPGQ